VSRTRRTGDASSDTVNENKKRDTDVCRKHDIVMTSVDDNNTITTIAH